jgi:Protein of unknwon function (DUF3310)
MKQTKQKIKLDKITQLIKNHPKVSAISVAETHKISKNYAYSLMSKARKNLRLEQASVSAPPAREEVINDVVNSPAYYKVGGIETIDFIQAKLTPEEFRGYLKGNILKYTSRAGHKDDIAIDIGKMVWYANRLQSTK